MDKINHDSSSHPFPEQGLNQQSPQESCLFSEKIYSVILPYMQEASQLPQKAPGTVGTSSVDTSFEYNFNLFSDNADYRALVLLVSKILKTSEGNNEARASLIKLYNELFLNDDSVESKNSNYLNLLENIDLENCSLLDLASIILAACKECLNLQWGQKQVSKMSLRTIKEWFEQTIASELSPDLSSRVYRHLKYKK